MKRILCFIIINMIIAAALCGCADHVEATPDTATPDIAAADEATRDEAVQPVMQPLLRAVTEAVTEPATEAQTEAEEPTENILALSRFNNILSRELSSDRVELYAEELYQDPELPTGCEAVALTIALDSLGYELEKTDIADKYMEYGSSFVTTYCGDPYSYGGAGIYPPGIVSTVNNFIEDTGAKIYPFDCTGLSMDELYRLINAGYPVVVWTTVYMNTPYFDGGEEYEGVFYPWYDLEHCVCMYGYDLDNDEVMISDPQRGKISVSASQFEEIYDDIGRFAVVMIKI